MVTARQKLAVDKIIENRGNVSRAMLEAGYTPATAKNPKNLTDSDGYKELMDSLAFNSPVYQSWLSRLSS